MMPSWPDASFFYEWRRRSLTYYLHADKFFLPNYTEGKGYLEITDRHQFGHFSTALPKGEKVVDYQGYWVAPGLVDTHIHGLLDHDIMDNSWNGINKMSEGLLKCGVTSWTPTTLTASFAEFLAVCQTIGQHYQEVDGAKIQGIHLEGPFYTEEHKGAQNPKYFVDPDISLFDRWQAAARGIIKKISIAPERAGAVDFIKHVVNKGVAVALGHSNATFEQAKACVEAGATVFTHTFNGMSGFNHRRLGMAGAAMGLSAVYDELICDGHHVDKEAVRILFKLKGPEHIALITDCMRAGLMPEGDYYLGELPVYVKNGMAQLKEGNSLAGSILKLNEAVKNVVDWDIATPAEAINMASSVPAKSSNIDDQCGAIIPGREADFLVLKPDMSLQATYLNGVLKYKA
jgi:N-acetylglucosamine-6-phosphate deacetylase